MKNSIELDLASNSRDRIINSMFWILPIALIILISLYWAVVVNPRIHDEAGRHAEMLAQSLEMPLVMALASFEGDERRTRMIEAMETILLYKDRKTGEPFILGITLDIDYDVVLGQEGELNLSMGRTIGERSFVIEVPLYSDRNRELMGIGSFYCNDFFFRRLQKSMGFRLILFLLTVLFFFFLAWIQLSKKIKVINQSEKNLREHEAQLVHAGRLSALGEMGAAIAHEINQPLAIIRLKADGLKASLARIEAEPRLFKAMDVIIEQVIRASGIIKSMRSFTRSAPNEAVDSIDVAAAVKEGLSFFREQFRIRQIRLDVSMPDRLPNIGVTRQKFEQIVVNFLSNARSAVEEKGEMEGRGFEKNVHVRLFHDPSAERVVFEVEDNGVGMSPEVKERCLEPFYTTKKLGEGTGLGLSITHGIAKEFDLNIEVESDEGSGSVFRVLAPVKE